MKAKRLEAGKYKIGHYTVIRVLPLFDSYGFMRKRPVAEWRVLNIGGRLLSTHTTLTLAKAWIKSQPENWEV